MKLSNRNITWTKFAENLSEAIPTSIDILLDEKKKQDVPEKAKAFLSEFNNIYNGLLNNVRVNLIQRLDPVQKGLEEIAKIAATEMPNSENERERDQFKSNLEAQLRNLKSQIERGANEAVTLMRTIVQECNEIIAVVSK